MKLKTVQKDAWNSALSEYFISLIQNILIFQLASPAVNRGFFVCSMSQHIKSLLFAQNDVLVMGTTTLYQPGICYDFSNFDK
jgi:hypothetical protein